MAVNFTTDIAATSDSDVISSADDGSDDILTSSVGLKMAASETSAVAVSQDIVFFSLTVIIPCGLLFNILSFVIYMRRQMRKRATSLYFAALAASDTLSLLTIMFDYWLKVSHTPTTFSLKGVKLL